MRGCHNRAQDKPLHFKLSVSSNGLTVCISPSQPSPFPLTQKILFCSLNLPMFLPYLYHVPYCNSLLFLNKHIFFFFFFAGEIIDFYFGQKWKRMTSSQLQKPKVLDLSTPQPDLASDCVTLFSLTYVLFWDFGFDW